MLTNLKRAHVHIHVHVHVYNSSCYRVTGKFEGNNLKNPIGYLASGSDIAEMNSCFQASDIVTALIRVVS